jgi:hypothetical protein
VKIRPKAAEKRRTEYFQEKSHLFRHPLLQKLQMYYIQGSGSIVFFRQDNHVVKYGTWLIYNFFSYKVGLESVRNDFGH